jgi:hypothetical protein
MTQGKRFLTPETPRSVTSPVSAMRGGSSSAKWVFWINASAREPGTARFALVLRPAGHVVCLGSPVPA